ASGPHARRLEVSRAGREQAVAGNLSGGQRSGGLALAPGRGGARDVRSAHVLQARYRRDSAGDLVGTHSPRSAFPSCIATNRSASYGAPLDRAPLGGKENDCVTSTPACIVVVPCFDEEHRLPASDFSRFIGQHDDVGLLFVNDGS